MSFLMIRKLKIKKTIYYIFFNLVVSITNVTITLIKDGMGLVELGTLELR